MSKLLRYWLFRCTSALRWYLRARTRYDVHSPFLSEFVREVYHDDRDYHAFTQIKEVRRSWSRRRDKVTLQSLGAESKTTRKQQRTAASLVRTNAIGSASGKFLFRLTLWLHPDRIIELGTNAGISTLYFHLPDQRTPLYTVEGNPTVSALAAETFQQVGVTKSLHTHTATFSEWFDARPPTPPGKLLAFIDGDHRYQPTLDYVDQLLVEATDDSVIIVADIHWSRGMERAWEKLKTHDRVTASVDTYHFGLLFLRPSLNGPHLTLISTRYKPWRVGFF